MSRSKLRNKFLKARKEESRRHFNPPKISVSACSAKLQDVFLGNKTIELSSTIETFGKQDHRVIFNNRNFWKTVGPLFSEKFFHKESIILNNNNKTISNNEELAEIFHKYFSKLAENLDIIETLASNMTSSDITDPVFNVIKKYKDHPSI